VELARARLVGLWSQLPLSGGGYRRGYGTRLSWVHAGDARQPSGSLMLTFDNQHAAPPDPIKELTQSNLPEQIEVGETGEAWLYVNRKSRLIEWVSKQTGFIVARCALDNALDAGVSPRVIAAARSALKL